MSMSSSPFAACEFPEELWIQILSYLSPRCLCNTMLVSTLFQRLSLTQSLWRSFCFQGWGVNSLDDWHEDGYSLFFQVYKLLYEYGYLIGVWKAEVSPRGGLLIIKLVGSEFVGYTVVAKECTELIPVFKIQVPFSTNTSSTESDISTSPSLRIFVTPICPHPRYSSTQPLLNPLINILYSMAHRRLENREVWEYVEGFGRPLLDDNDDDFNDSDEEDYGDYFSTNNNNHNNNNNNNNNDNDTNNRNNSNNNSSSSNSQSHLIDSDMEEWKVGSIKLLLESEKEERGFSVFTSAYFETDEEEGAQSLVIYPWGVLYTKLEGIELDGKLAQKQPPQHLNNDDAVLIHPVCANFNIGGLWKSVYGAHSWEVVQIKLYTLENSESIIAARKIIGDPNVPAGKFTWRTLPIQYGDSADGLASQGRLAEVGFVRPQWEHSVLSIIDENHVNVLFPASGFQLTYVRLFEQVPLNDLE
eukprot:TRINITY_DN2337_c0_g1_i11.p1 TRINITY_DN2337_c0_g1~~TRINITY_DN2337_c0_g1_i11.p1  ORF type:complete len:471 (-),score=111.05 TRINITY_DN2337_c0_g1_i11:111-1523(-)